MTNYQGIVHRYREFLPIAENVPVVTLNEGNTPLIKLHNLVQSKQLNLSIYVKFEGLNPTASFKDRGMTLAVTHAVAEGSRAIICASTGNTSAAAAAYAARAGIKSFVIIPEGKIASGKLAQAVAHGATILQIKGNFDEGLQLVKQLADELPLTIVNSTNPFRLQGQKTAAFEVLEQLDRVPDYHCLPVGNAGNISAYWMGYQESMRRNVIDSLPKMVGYQAANAAPFVHGAPIDSPETVATAIRIGHPQSWQLANEATAQSGGWFAPVSDDAILAAQRLLASSEGIFAEPASCASIAGVLADAQAGKIPDDSVVVCTLTGHGLKDTDVVTPYLQEQSHNVKASLNDVRSVIEKLL